MFYSHESPEIPASWKTSGFTDTYIVLTSRENGVATVWLVATLGSKSNLRKVNRKAILEVNVPKTCGVIINPEAPMALRLQGNLLYGVSRVYLQQCGYILSDAENARANMKILSKILRTASLDPNAGKARPDQLVLEDDPAFVPDMGLPGLDIDLRALDISTDEASRRSSLLSPPSQQTTLSSQSSIDASMPGLIIPSSDDGGVGDLGGFNVPSSDRTSVRRDTGMGELFHEAEDDFNLDPGFIFDDEGNLILTGDDAPPSQMGQAQPVPGRMRSESGASSHVRRELEEGRQVGQLELGNAMDFDFNIPQINDDDLVLPQAEAFTPLGTQARAVPHDESSSETAFAPQQRKQRQPRILPYDLTQELRNSNLTQWNNDYLANMQQVKKSKLEHRAVRDAKRNAAFCVFGAGIGGVGQGIGVSAMKGPLAELFAGDALMRSLTGDLMPTGSRKRGRSGDEADETGSEERRVRLREGDEERGRGQVLNLEDDDGAMILPGSDAIEMGRHALPALEDTSQFPWNRSASARDSRPGSDLGGQGFGSSIGGFTVSGGPPSSLPGVGGPGSMDRRASRITSASPLIGRGRERYDELDMPQFDDDELLGGPSGSIAGDDFQLYGPAANVDTQTAVQSQWIRATLDTESDNFLVYIKTKIADKSAPAAEDEDELSRNVAASDLVSFEELLPPSQNSRIVAAQGFHHVLALATKNLVGVNQEEAYGPITLRLAAGI
ncbi:MAG: hypothetical protein Q9222_004293 [Ikaeria aurantiellina]